MGMRRGTFIALLRGINVGGHNKLPMTELRALCAELGWENVQSYIQSGNLVFASGGRPASLETELERAIEAKFGLSIPVFVRTVGDWRSSINGNPFPEESRKEPNLVMLALSKDPPKKDAAQGLQEKALGGEQVEQVGDDLWIYFPGGSGRSKLSPGLLDRIAGSAVTTRNWRTALKLAEMAGQTTSGK
jgi:uncharacterized protein (DUF1697 family)